MTLLGNLSFPNRINLWLWPNDYEPTAELPIVPPLPMKSYGYLAYEHVGNVA